MVRKHLGQRTLVLSHAMELVTVALPIVGEHSRDGLGEQFIKSRTRVDIQGCYRLVTQPIRAGHQ